MAIRTIFVMAEACARGERLGWQEFVRDYAGIARRLLTHYFPELAPRIGEHLVATFQYAGEPSRNWFTGLKFTNEREFMMAFRELIFAYGRTYCPSHASEITLDHLRAAITDLPLLDREMLWLRVKGYAGEQIAAMMMHAAATAKAVEHIAKQRLAELIPGELRVLIELAEQSKTDQCVSLKTFNNFVNGQITWRERESAEKHMAECFYCIDRFTSFLEMIRLRKDVVPLPEANVDSMLMRLPFVSAKRSGIFSRLFAAR
jgi:hypothetical protein